MFSPAARAHSEATRGDTYASATASFVAGAVHFWNEAPFVRGGYTSPHVTEPSWARAAVQETHCGRVFFAGACIVRPAAAPISCSLHVTRGRRRSMQRFYSGSRQPLDTSWCVCFVSSSGVRLIMPALHFRHHDYRRTRCAPSRDAARGSPQSNIEAVSVMPCGGTPRGTPHRWRSCRWGY